MNKYLQKKWLKCAPSSLDEPAEKWSRRWQALIMFESGINVEKDDTEKFFFISSAAKVEYQKARELW